MPLEMGSGLGLDAAPSRGCWPLRDKYSGPAVDRQWDGFPFGNRERLLVWCLCLFWASGGQLAFLCLCFFILAVWITVAGVPVVP